LESLDLISKEYGIGRLLYSLQEQTLLKGSYETEFIVVSNGSYDNMVAVAKGKSIKNNSNSKFEPPAF